jgi:hypothetical protein
LTPTLQAAQRKERLEALHDQLTDQVAKLTNSADWMRMLQMASKMHNYSFAISASSWRKKRTPLV